MQIKPHQNKDGIVFEFVRWAYDVEKKRGKSLSLGRMPATWTHPPKETWEKFTAAEQEEFKQFMKAKNEAERLHKIKRSVKLAVEYMTACTERFQLDKDSESEADAAELCSVIVSCIEVLKQNGYTVPFVTARTKEKAKKKDSVESYRLPGDVPLPFNR